LVRCVYLGEVVVDVERGQLGEVPVEAQRHEEAGVLVGQLGALWLVVGDPGRVHLTTEEAESHDHRGGGVT